MILLIKHEEDGKRKICDHRCYRSPGKNCNCICEELNHGLGLKAAVEHTLADREYFESHGIEVMVEDRLLFDIDPMKIKKGEALSTLSV